MELSTDSEKALRQTLAHWHANGAGDVWIFGYASLIWRPEFEFIERRKAQVHGYRRALEMISTINRGTPECPGLVCAMLPSASSVCEGVAFRVAAHQFEASLNQLWDREMPNAVYDVPWLDCTTESGLVQALAFTLPLNSPCYCGQLKPAQYQHIFSNAHGRYGSTLEYAQLTYDCLLAEGIEDHALKDLLELATIAPLAETNHPTLQTQ